MSNPPGAEPATAEHRARAMPNQTTYSSSRRTQKIAEVPHFPRKTIVPNKPGTYCSGALRLQWCLEHNETATPQDTIVTTPGASQKTICKYCNLELDLELPHEYFVAKSGSDEENSMSEDDKSQTRLLFFSQHIIACASLRNRKAMFRCWPCERSEEDAEFRTLENLVEHYGAMDHWRTANLAWSLFVSQYRCRNLEIEMWVSRPDRRRRSWGRYTRGSFWKGQ